MSGKTFCQLIDRRENDTTMFKGSWMNIRARFVCDECGKWQ